MVHMSSLSKLGSDITMVPGFAHYHPHHDEVTRNRRIDLALFVALLAAVIAYAAFAWEANFNPKNVGIRRPLSHCCS